MKLYKTMIIAGVLGLVIPEASFAAPVSLIGADAFGTSSFNSAGLWSNGSAPSSGNDYYNADYLLRTPFDASDHTFAGDSLTITGYGLAGFAGNDALMWKGYDTTARITVNNLIIDGGQLRHGQASWDSFTLDGNLTVGANGATLTTQGGMFIESSIHGSDTMRILDSGAPDPERIIVLASSGNTFTGDIELYGRSPDYAKFALAENANMNFEIGASGVNNRLYGTGAAWLHGNFIFDLTAAGTTVGDSWLVEDAEVQFYTSTFTVDGFSNQGDGTWYLDNGNAEYSFDTNTGTLSVIPEPATLSLLCMVGGCMHFMRRYYRG